MANKYETRRFEPVNNAEYDFYEVSVNGKYLCQRFLDEIKRNYLKYMPIWIRSLQIFCPHPNFVRLKG